MSSTNQLTIKSDTTKLDNSTYNILRALGREAVFYILLLIRNIEDARKDGRNQLVDV
jgi:hypothetical protein